MSKPTIDNYESEHTQFLRELFEKRPYLAEQQKEARAMWWDKKLNQEELKRFTESKVPQSSYVYFDWLKK
ncbi:MULTISPECIES: DUF3460 family protein [Nitrosomonas]|uniref:Uncharacterized protein DUF3460 n=1 Tax=Nitrosomonas communis TaxID=44574 RepID=A0A0F7KF71_9PROT|nr:MULTISPECIES: DUF3460 family protein [Nitrosomonas]AKH37798.1 hypothetical protein AAW31_08250 [Nitrosomonas communis]TYP84872.1 uncharacterized protein DUF3460 [Nitrosomonas communis]UVS63142.1 DUF3460 family protein [Nitrosomonas sp. PLL12]